MEIHTMFLDWKNQSCQNDNVPQAMCKFSTIPIKLPMAFFIELENKIFILYGNTKDQNS